HGRHAGLSCRKKIAIRNVVVLPLALRDVGGHGAPGVLGTVRPLSEAEDYHASPRWNDSVLRRPRRRRPEGSWATDFGRGLFENPAIAEAAAHGLPARILRGHGNVRRWPTRNEMRARIFRGGSSGLCNRYAARPDCADDQDRRRARTVRRGPQKDLFR